MECNRDEATRAKEIAESKFTKKDIMGAKKFALKAQNLYPGLDGISQFLATLDVYVAAENKINGELDFYGILGVGPFADDDTVRKSYRKLVLSLHPDKNKSLGADGAFKFVSEAWSFLSDKDKRLAYDHRRNGRVVRQQKVQTQNGGSRPPTPSGQNGFHNFTKTTPAQTKFTPAQTKVTPVQTKVTPPRTKVTPTKDDVNVNATVKIPTKDMGNKQVEPKTFWTVCKRCKLQYEFLRMYLNRNLLCPTCYGPFLANEVPPPKGHADSANHTTSPWAPFLKKTGPADVAQAASLVQEAYQRVKRDREEAQADTKRKEALRRKISKWAADVSTKDVKKFKEEDEGKKEKSNKDVKKPKEEAQGKKEKSNKTRLMKRATTEIKKKLNEWSSEDQPQTEMVEIDVPDSEFHDFDDDRSEKCFKKDEVWAAYDDRDEMPRFYAMVHEVISLNPFKIKIFWLNPESNNPEIMEAFGEFKLGRQDIVTVTNYFSHKANFTKQPNGNIRIFPRNGDVCGLYRNDPIPNKSKPNYEIVQMYEFNEETGVITVTPLVKVSGFKTVFQRRNETRVISSSEMFRFSHQIPSYFLNEESLDAPKGCWELDPAAIPPEFLQDCGGGLVDLKEGGGDDDVDDDVEECSKY